MCVCVWGGGVCVGVFVLILTYILVCVCTRVYVCVCVCSLCMCVCVHVARLGSDVVLQVPHLPLHRLPRPLELRIPLLHRRLRARLRRIPP